MGKINFKNYGSQKNWISGCYEDSNSLEKISVISPYFDKEIATVPDSNVVDLNLAVERSKLVFPHWSKVNIRDRAEVMFQLKSILEKNMEELAYLIALDNGKTIEDAKGSILRGKEVVEFACKLLKTSIPKTISFEELGDGQLKDFYRDSKKVSNEKIKEYFKYKFKYPTYAEGLREIQNHII